MCRLGTIQSVLAEFKIRPLQSHSSSSKFKFPILLRSKCNRSTGSSLSYLPDAAEWSKPLAMGSKDPAMLSKLLTSYSKPPVDESKLLTDLSKLLAQGSKNIVRESKLATKRSREAAKTVAKYLKELLNGANSYFQVADAIANHAGDGANTVFKGATGIILTMLTHSMRATLIKTKLKLVYGEQIDGLAR